MLSEGEKKEKEEEKGRKRREEREEKKREREERREEREEKERERRKERICRRRQPEFVATGDFTTEAVRGRGSRRLHRTSVRVLLFIIRVKREVKRVSF